MTGYITMGEALDMLDEGDAWRQFQVHYPEAKSADGRLELINYTIPRNDIWRIRTIATEGPNRDPGYGSFTKLVEHTPDDDRPRVWMSDTRAEILEHSPVLSALMDTDDKPVRMLVNGLGLGMIVKAALMRDNVTRVDVVEKDADVIDLILPLIKDDRLVVYHSDAFTKSWPRGINWDIVWHDIWPEISEQNLPGMRRLHRKYDFAAAWQGSWQRVTCEAMYQAAMEMVRQIIREDGDKGKQAIIAMASDESGRKLNLQQAIKWVAGQMEK